MSPRVRAAYLADRYVASRPRSGCVRSSLVATVESSRPGHPGGLGDRTQEVLAADPVELAVGRRRDGRGPREALEYADLAEVIVRAELGKPRPAAVTRRVPLATTTSRRPDRPPGARPCQPGPPRGPPRSPAPRARDGPRPRRSRSARAVRSRRRAAGRARPIHGPPRAPGGTRARSSRGSEGRPRPSRPRARSRAPTLARSPCRP